MKDILLTTLRDKNSTQIAFRDAAEKLALILAAEVSSLLSTEKIQTQTPLEMIHGTHLKNQIALIPILRSGLALLYPFLRFYQAAKIGFIGMRRDEETAHPHMYYYSLPKFGPEDEVIILEPMLATGGSILASLKFLEKNGVSPKKMIVAGIIGAPEGFAFLNKEMPEVKLHILQVDEKLNAKKFIVPGLGDFGDRFFGTDTHPLNNIRSSPNL